MFKTLNSLRKKKTGHHQCLDVMTLFLLHCLIPPVCSCFPDGSNLIRSYWFSNLRYFLIWEPFYRFSSLPVLFHLPSPSVVDSFKTWLTLNSPSPNYSRFLLYLSRILNSIVRIGTYYFFTDFLIFYHPTKSCLGKEGILIGCGLAYFLLHYLAVSNQISRYLQNEWMNEWMNSSIVPPVPC